MFCELERIERFDVCGHLSDKVVKPMLVFLKRVFGMKLGLNIWKRGSQRAPHKPLLLLYALGKWSQGQKQFDWRTVKRGQPIDRTVWWKC